MNFQTQKKILEPILKNSKNSHCADCNAASPTCTQHLTQGLLSILVFSCAQIVQEHIED